MNTVPLASPFGRILWKEYRAQRVLWFACLGIGSVIMLICWYAEPGSSRWRDQAAYPAVPWIIGIMYAIGCAAMLFSREREERTSEWLLSLSVPAMPTLAAKVLFAIVSTICLQSMLTLLEWTFSGTVSSLWDPRQLFSLFILVVALLGSLTSRRVLSSIAAMIFWAAITIFVPIGVARTVAVSLFHASEFTTTLGEKVVLIGLWCSVVPFEIRVGLKWCRGHYMDASAFDRFTALFQRFWQRWFAFEIAASRIPATSELEQPWRRTWQRLIWQERHRESLPWVLLGAFCVIGPLLAVIAEPTRCELTILIVWVCVAIPVGMGVMGFESDVELQQSRFLCNRGVSPAAVWLAKQIIWLPRAFWITGIIFFVSLFFERQFPLRSHGTLSPMMRNPLQQGYQLLQARYDLAIWYIFLAYACGQFASMVCRRVVLAGVFGLFLTCLAANWMFFVEFLQFPQWWALGIPCLMLLGITCRQMKARMLEQHGLNNILKTTLAISTTCVIVVAGLAYFRIAQVQATASESKQAWLDALKAVDAYKPLTPGDHDISTKINALNRSLVTDTNPESSEVVYNLMQRKVERLNLSQEESAEANLARVFANLNRIADDFIASNQLDKAFDRYLASLKLARLAAQERPLTNAWMICNDWQLITLEKMVAWANLPEQSADSIQSASWKIDVELSKFPLASEALLRTYLQEQNVIDRLSRENVSDYAPERHLIPHNPYDLAAATMLPWEKQRLRLLLSREGEYLYGKAIALERMLLSYPADHQVRFVQLTPYQLILTEPPFLPGISRASALPVQTIILTRTTAIRAVLTRFGLLTHRKQHGRLPNRLLELLSTMEARNVVDPWSNRLFEYYPEFLLSTGNSNSAVLPMGRTQVALIGHFNCSSSRFTSGFPKGFHFERRSELDRYDVQNRVLFPIPEEPSPSARQP